MESEATMTNEEIDEVAMMSQQRIWMMNNNHPINCLRNHNKNDVYKHAPPISTGASENAGIVPVKSLTRSSPRLLKTRRRSSVSCSSPVPPKKLKITSPASQQRTKYESCSTILTNVPSARSSPRLLRRAQQQSNGSCNSPYHPLKENQAVSTPLSSSNFKMKTAPSGSQQQNKQRHLTPMKSSQKKITNEVDGASAAVHKPTVDSSELHHTLVTAELCSTDKDDGGGDVLFPVTTAIESSNNEKMCTTEHQLPVVLKPSTTMTAAEINVMAQQLFENNSSHTGDDEVQTMILDRPCVSARLFACYVLHSDKEKDFLQPMLEFLRAMVQWEAVSLGSGADEGDDVVVADESDDVSAVCGCDGDDSSADTSSGSAPATAEKKKTDSRKTRVHFSAFDGSSTKPPVDREIGSGFHQVQSIKAMVKAKEQIQALTLVAIPCIQDLENFLLLHLTDAMRSECAAAVEQDYPPKRVQTLADLYAKDLITLKRRLLQGSSQCLSPPLLVEQRLAQILGRGIRFHLRRFFNSAPPRMSNTDHAYDERATAYSQVSALINMTLPDGQVNEAVSDAFISALVSNALCCLNEFFGLESLLNATGTLDHQHQMPEVFCASLASQRTLSVRSKDDTEPLTEDDCFSVVQDIQEATAFLSVSRAARFLLDLQAAPGVSDEIERMGGWSQVETYASTLWTYDLYKLCHSDAHLVALSNFPALLQRLRAYTATIMTEHVVEQCEQALALVYENYHLKAASAKKQAWLRKYPALADIARVYTESMEQAQSFPRVLPVTVDQE